MTSKSLVVALFIFLSLHTGAGPADAAKDVSAEEPARSTPKYFDTFTLYLENDFFAGTDRDYTNGIKFTWSTPYGDLEKTSLPAWSFPIFERLPFINQAGGKRAVSLSLGQDIFTPVETDRSDLILDDRPYAGYTYLAAGFHTQRLKRKDSWEIRIGIVGPAALGQKTQNLVHDAIGADRANGWDHQLDNEVTIDLICETQWRRSSRKFLGNLGIDLIPHLGGRLGTVKTYLNGGAEVRFGWRLPNDFGSCPIRGGCETNSAFDDQSPTAGTFHFFVSADGMAIARDIFLDGNTFTSSHSVDKEPLVGELMGGFVWQKGRAKITYAYIYRSQQFKTQQDNQVYGSLSLAWTY